MVAPLASWVGQPHVKGKTESLRMMLLTSSIIGLQFAWGTEMTYCTPYLLSLGMTKSRLSLVWVAGPLSGLVMQPIIGMLSDKSTSKYGRRRPYMVGGSAAVVTCYLLLGWAKEIAGLFVSDPELKRQYAIMLAIVDIYILDFMINIVHLPSFSSGHYAGNETTAWSCVEMAGVGHLMVYAVGALDLHSIFGNVFGDTQFKKVCVIAALAMAASQGLSAWAVTERVLVSDGKDARKDGGIFSVLASIYSTVRHVPERIQAICWVQFWSWIGWFPFLFYGSTWVGEIYLRHEVESNISPKDALDEVGMRGSRALIVYSLVGTLSSIFVPWLVKSPADDEKPEYTVRPPRIMAPILNLFRRRKPTLLRVWAFGNLLFAAAMIFAPFVQSVSFATLLVAICGVPNAIGSLAAVTFLGVEVNRMSTCIPLSQGRNLSRRPSTDSIELEETTSPTTLHLRQDSESSITPSSTGELSGIYLGILNIYTTLPQFVGTGISWVVFSILEPGLSSELAKGAEPDDQQAADGLSGIGVCLFIGALCALVAAWATRRLRSSY